MPLGPRMYRLVGVIRLLLIQRIIGHLGAFTRRRAITCAARTTVIIIIYRIL